MTMDAHPLSYFDRIFVVNLPSRTDRRREMERQFRRIGLAMDAPFIEVFTAIRPADKGPFDSVGARGAFMSHLGVMKLSLREQYQRILILEDDVNFIDDFNFYCTRAVSRLTNEAWHVFYGGYRLLEPQALGGATPCIDPERSIMLAHFVGLQRTAIATGIQLLEKLLTRAAGDPNGGPMQVDGAYSWLRRLNPHLITRLAVPELGYQRSSRTDIHDLHWFDRLPGVREITGLARSLKNIARRR